MQIFTIGYEGLVIDDFLNILRRHQVQHLIDVRAIAMSRKVGFAKTALSNACATIGLSYSHWPMLGCPNDIRTTYRVNGNWQQYTDSFLPYLATQVTAMTALAEAAQTETCALMCFEADANYCHRSFVADDLQKYVSQSVKVIHLTRNSIPSAPLAAPLAGR